MGGAAESLLDHQPEAKHSSLSKEKTREKNLRNGLKDQQTNGHID